MLRFSPSQITRVLDLASTPGPPGRRTVAALSPRQRALGGAELALGAAIVIGHNVFRVLPNEVPILFGLGLISSWVRNGSWSAIGLRRPASWPRVVALATAAAVLRLALGDLVIDPITSYFWPPEVTSKIFDSATGNPVKALRLLGIVWTFAAFGEEVSYRGYLLERAAECAGGSRLAYAAAVMVSAVLFGYGHYYKGPSGIVDSGVAGLILGGVYLLSGRNLWPCVLAHGFIDSLGVVLVYFGVAS